METVFKGIEESIIDFSIHEYSCRIVQRMLESCHQSYLTNCITTLLDNFFFLTQKEFGIFVLSAMLQHCQDDVRNRMLSMLHGRCGSMSLMKDGSKLIENAVRLLENKQASLRMPELNVLLQEIVNIPLKQDQTQSEVYFEDLLQNRFSNYVIQTCFDVSDDQGRSLILYKMSVTLKGIPKTQDSCIRHIIKHLKHYGITVQGQELVFGPNCNFNLEQWQPGQQASSQFQMPNTTN